jgi:hypothetical protein
LAGVLYRDSLIGLFVRDFHIANEFLGALPIFSLESSAYFLAADYAIGPDSTVTVSTFPGLVLTAAAVASKEDKHDNKISNQ